MVQCAPPVLVVQDVLDKERLRVAAELPVQLDLGLAHGSPIPPPHDDDEDDGKEEEGHATHCCTDRECEPSAAALARARRCRRPGGRR